MEAGVYEHNEHKGDFYLLLGLARLHDGSCVSSDVGDEFIAYIPLRVEPEWSGTARIALRTPADFAESFTFVGDRLP